MTYQFNSIHTDSTYQLSTPFGTRVDLSLSKAMETEGFEKGTQITAKLAAKKFLNIYFKAKLLELTSKKLVIIPLSLGIMALSFLIPITAPLLVTEIALEILFFVTLGTGITLPILTLCFQKEILDINQAHKKRAEYAFQERDRILKSDCNTFIW